MRTIAQISDLHFGRQSDPVVEALLVSIAQYSPDIVVVSGDLTQRARASEFIGARRFLDRIAAPMVVVPGNHDLPLYNIAERLLRPLRNYHRFIGPLDQSDGFYNDGTLAVLGLNTSRRLSRKNGRISTEQIAMIKKRFSAVPLKTFKAVVTHHPFAGSADNTRIELAERSAPALAALAVAGVKLLMSGHHHVARTSEWIDVRTGRSLLIVHAGTAVSKRVRGNDGNPYNIIRIDPGGVTVRILEWRKESGFETKMESRHGLFQRGMS